MADLEFAARIGKILLEQNKELEDHSKTLQEKISDQDAKILVSYSFWDYVRPRWGTFLISVRFLFYFCLQMT